MLKTSPITSTTTSVNATYSTCASGMQQPETSAAGRDPEVQGACPICMVTWAAAAPAAKIDHVLLELLDYVARRNLCSLSFQKVYHAMKVATISCPTVSMDCSTCSKVNLIASLHNSNSHAMLNDQSGAITLFPPTSFFNKTFSWTQVHPRTLRRCSPSDQKTSDCRPSCSVCASSQ